MDAPKKKILKKLPKKTEHFRGYNKKMRLLMSFFDFNCDSCCLMIYTYIKNTVKHEAKKNVEVKMKLLIFVLISNFWNLFLEIYREYEK